jgi:hypothetical protein
MTGRVLGLLLLAPLVLAQACRGPAASTRAQLRTVTVAVEGMAAHNGIL